MIEYVKGPIVALSPTSVVVDGGPTGFIVNISLNTYSALEGNSECRLLTHLQIREDAWTLYGFATEDERILFRALIGVSGVGAATAMLILSAFGTDTLQAVIAGGDAKALKNVKGVGSKTAERIIVDLRDKIKAAGNTLITVTPVSSDAYDEALSALCMLGYTKAGAQKALKKLFSEDPAMKVEVAIKKALAMM